MNKNMLAIISALLSGILIVFIPLFIWHQVNFPDRPPNLCDLRKEATGSETTYGPSPEETSISPFYATLVISLIVSMIVYLFSKRGV